MEAVGQEGELGHGQHALVHGAGAEQEGLLIRWGGGREGLERKIRVASSFSTRMEDRACQVGGGSERKIRVANSSTSRKKGPVRWRVG